MTYYGCVVCFQLNHLFSISVLYTTYLVVGRWQHYGKIDGDGNVCSDERP